MKDLMMLNAFNPDNTTEKEKQNVEDKIIKKKFLGKAFFERVLDVGIPKRKIDIIFFLEYCIKSEDEAKKICNIFNKNEIAPGNWNYFKEETGNKNWVIYSEDMYEIWSKGCIKYLHYRQNSVYQPIIPIGASSCHCMFEVLDLKGISLAEFETHNVVDMNSMFAYYVNIDCLDGLKPYNFATEAGLDTSKVEDMECMFSDGDGSEISFCGFNTTNVKYAAGMFENSEASEIDLRNTNFENVKDVSEMFSGCEQLIYVYTTFNWNENSGIGGTDMFKDCWNLHNFNANFVGIERANHYNGGYFK